MNKLLDGLLVLIVFTIGVMTIARGGIDDMDYILLWISLIIDRIFAFLEGIWIDRREQYLDELEQCIDEREVTNELCE